MPKQGKYEEKVNTLAPYYKKGLTAPPELKVHTNQPTVTVCAGAEIIR
jgi:hypothetical protein